MNEVSDYENNFTLEWLKNLLDGIKAVQEENEKANISSALFKKCAMYHYNSNNMDDVLQKFAGNLDGFLSFLEKEWDWRIQITEDRTKIIIDENKNFCVCPVVHTLKENIPHNICSCSEQFAKHMFSKILEKEVEAKVVRSFIRDKKSCMYEIKIN